MVPFRGLRAVRTRLWSHWWFHCTFLFVLRRHRVAVNMTWALGTLSWLNVKAFKRAPTPQTCKVLRPWAFFHETMVSALLVNCCYSYRTWVYMYILLECHVICTDNWLATILRCYVWKSDMVLVMIAWKVYNFQLKPILRSLAPLFHTEKLSLP